ncbi:MAG: hypothetical protein AAF328_00300 [Planctomycetota bacterium]
MNRPNVRESRGSDDSAQTDSVAPRGDHYRWLPPVLALLLLMVVLLTLQAPGGGAGDQAAGGATEQGLATGVGNGNEPRERGGAESGEAAPLGGRDTNRADNPNAAGYAFDDPPAASRWGGAGASSASQDTPVAAAPETDPLGAAASNPPAPSSPLPALGFATDLAASPQPREPNPVANAQATPAAVGEDAAGRAGTPGLASFFGTEGHGTRFAYLIDKSGSMSGAPFDAAKAELIRSLRALQTHEHFFVAFYDGQAEFMPGERLLPATPRNIERAVAWVRAVSLGGSTDPTEALTHTLTRVRPDTIWLLSDGAFSAAVVDTIASRNPRGKTHINTLAFINRGGEALLKIIADQNNGDYRFVPGP